MAALAILFGVVLVVAAIRNTHTELFSALEQDVPGFAIWAAAIIAVAAIGFVPGLKPVSRGLLALVITVIIVVNYKQILAGFQSTWEGAKGQAAGAGGSTNPLSEGGIGNVFNALGQVDFSSLAGPTGATATGTNG